MWSYILISFLIASGIANVILMACAVRSRQISRAEEAAFGIELPSTNNKDTV